MYVQPESQVEEYLYLLNEVILKQGYLMKKGGGESRFGRKNWKLRYFVLWKTVLIYYKNEHAFAHHMNLLRAAAERKRRQTQPSTSPPAPHRAHQRTHSLLSFPSTTADQKLFLGQISLSKVSAVRIIQDKEGTGRTATEFCFKVKTPGRTYFFSWKEHTFASSWVTELKAAVLEIQSERSHGLREVTTAVLLPNKSYENVFSAFENSPVQRKTPTNESFATFLESMSIPIQSSDSFSYIAHNSPEILSRCDSMSNVMAPVIKKRSTPDSIKSPLSSSPADNDKDPRTFQGPLVLLDSIEF